MYVFSYFKTDDEAMYLATSSDGLAWQELNGGKPVLRSVVGTGQLRDPMVYRDAEGTFHAVWTDGWRSQSIGYARSADLLNWTEQRLLPVMEALPGTQNTWAPEVFWDAALGKHRIIWSSTVLKEGEAPPKDHRIWSAVTADFQEFSPAAVFFDPGYNVIDANVTDIGDEYVMLFKDERGTNTPDTDYKALRSCRFGKSGLDRPEMTAISPLLTPRLTEGPALFPLTGEGERGWVLLFDYFESEHYGVWFTPDLIHWEDWSKRASLPTAPRHGHVLTMKPQ
ncbi:glycoside hydrolase family 43 protein [Paenibacillus sp. y28]|uniref:glycoside hydrolase family 43 protein n=1 Tax=Paenibacillus sp. y28 TaxID=3129110 RepID=UPI00301691D3